MTTSGVRGFEPCDYISRRERVLGDATDGIVGHDDPCGRSERRMVREIDQRCEKVAVSRLGVRARSHNELCPKVVLLRDFEASGGHNRAVLPLPFRSLSLRAVPRS